MMLRKKGSTSAVKRLRFSPLAVGFVSIATLALMTQHHFLQWGENISLSQRQQNPSAYSTTASTSSNTNTNKKNDDTKDDGDEDDLFALAAHESLGFFQDIPKDEWLLLKEKVKDIYPNTVDHAPPSSWRNRGITANRFFQDHFEPDFNCRHERRIGRLGDGGKWTCDPHRLKKKKKKNTTPPPPCLVYSVGSNGDSSFEAAVRNDIGPHCEIHTFDMKNYTDAVEKVGAHFHQWGISDTSSRRHRGGQEVVVYKTLQQTVEELGHVGRTIDIFKIDCEGCEWSTYPSFFTAGVTLRQVLIELHASPNPADQKGSKFQNMPMPQTFDFFDAMYHHGYVIFHKEVNIRFWHFGQCIEYAFLKLHPDFFSDIIIPPALEQLGARGTIVT